MARMWVLIVLGACLAAPAGCERARKGTPEGQATPAECFKKVFACLCSGDREGLLGAVFTNAENRDAIGAIAELSAAYKEFEETFRKRFGDEAWEAAGLGSFSGGLDDETIDALLAELELTVEGDRAFLSSGEGAETVRFARENGSWKMDADAVIGIMQMGHIANVAEIVKVLTRSVRAATAETGKPGVSSEDVVRKVREAAKEASAVAEPKHDPVAPPPHDH